MNLYSGKVSRKSIVGLPLDFSDDNLLKCRAKLKVFMEVDPNGVCGTPAEDSIIREFYCWAINGRRKALRGASLYDLASPSWFFHNTNTNKTLVFVFCDETKPEGYAAVCPLIFTSVR